MAKFIVVTKRFNVGSPEMSERKESALVNIKKIQGVDANFSDSGGSIIYLTSNNATIHNVAESPDEIHALIKEAQGDSQPKMLFKGRPLGEADPDELRATLPSVPIRDRATVVSAIERLDAETRMR